MIAADSKTGTANPIAAHIPALDGLRGIAIAAVMAFHFFAPLQLGAFSKVSRLGWTGVDLFFVLSGFLITGNLLDTKGKRRYYRDFLLRRGLRIFPLYWICLAVFVAVASLQHLSLTGSDSPVWFAVYLGSIPQAVSNISPQIPVFRPLWSLQIEEQFYIVFPFLVSALSVRNLRIALWCCVLSAVALRLLLVLSFGDASRLATYVLAPCRMDALALGGLIALRTKRSPVSGHASIAALASAVLACVVLFQLRAPSFRDPVVRTVGFTLIALCAATALQFCLSFRDAPVTGFLRSRPLRYIGKISYGLYLLQMPAEVIVKAFLPFKGYLSSAATVALSLLFATATWYCIERPFAKLRHRF